MVTVAVVGQLEPETYDRHTQSRANTRSHRHTPRKSLPPRPPLPPTPTHRRTHGEAATEALSRPPLLPKKFAYVSMRRQRGEHVLNGDRGEVDYTVSTGDLMTDTHNAPHSADDRHHEEWTGEDCKRASVEQRATKSLQTLGMRRRGSHRIWTRVPSIVFRHFVLCA